MKKRLPTGILCLLVVVLSLSAGEITFTIHYKSDTPARVSEETVEAVVTSALNLDKTKVPYYKAGVFVFPDRHQGVAYYEVILYRKDIFSAKIFRLDVERDGTITVTEDYIPPEDEDAERVCPTCPDESIDVVLSAAVDYNTFYLSHQKVDEAYTLLTNAGLKVVKLHYQEATLTAIKNWLSCKNLKMWARIGHGTEPSKFAVMYNDEYLRPSYIETLVGQFHHKIMHWNSCYLHAEPMIGAVIRSADGYFFCSGNNVQLAANQSEYAWYNIIKDCVIDGMEFGQSVTSNNASLNPAKLYGYTRNDAAPNNQCFWKDITEEMLGLDSPNGGGGYMVSTVLDITWTSNSDKAVSIYLMKGTTTVETIVENTENDGEYSWEIPENIDAGSNYKIRIKADDLVDESDETFTIKKKPHIVCETNAISSELDNNTATEEKILKITNDGEGSLSFSAAVGGVGAVMINEIYIGYSEPDDGFEMWNRGPDQDMTGWSVKWNDSERGAGEYTFKDGYVFTSGSTIVLNDAQGSEFYLGSLPWEESTELSIALCDANGNGVDFVRTAGNTDQPPAGTAWDGEGVANGEAYIYRTGNEDTDSREDWTTGTSGTINALNPGQSNSQREEHWLSVEPTEGVVNATGAIDLKITFTGTGLDDGDYYDTVLIVHDDPDTESPLRVPCKLTKTTNTGIYVTDGGIIHTFGITCRASRIIYRIPAWYTGKQVRIELYSLTGKLVKTLVNGTVSTGRFILALDRYKELAAGNYICRMTAGTYQEAIPVVNHR